MLIRFWSSFTRILNWDVGGPIKRVLFFDINRILLWDVSGQPIPTIVLKGFAGIVAAGLLLAVMIPALASQGWRMPEWGPLLVIIGTVAAFIAPDLRRPARR